MLTQESRVKPGGLIFFLPDFQANKQIAAPAARKGQNGLSVWCAGALSGLGRSTKQRLARGVWGAAMRRIAPAAAAQPMRCAGAQLVAPRPAGDVWIWRAGASGCTFRLPPARSSARKMVAKWRPTDGSGVAVATATVAQPFCNHHDIDTQRFSLAVARLHPLASRDVRVCRRAGARACRTFRNPATLQPSIIIQWIEWLSGCKTVAPRLQLQPGMRCCATAADGLPIRNILAGGYGAALCGVLIRGWIEGHRGETFGPDGCAGVARGEVEGGQVLGRRNGGNQPFLGVALGRVGKAVLEWIAQGYGLPAIFRRGRKLSHLAHGEAGRAAAGRGGIDRAEAPRPSPIAAMMSAARWRCHFSENQTGRRPHLQSRLCAVWRGCQTSSGRKGPGVWVRAKLVRPATGPGAGARVGCGRIGKVKGGAAYVQ